MGRPGWGRLAAVGPEAVGALAGRPSGPSAFPVPAIPVKGGSFAVVRRPFPRHPGVLPWVFWGLRRRPSRQPSEALGNPSPRRDQTAPERRTGSGQNRKAGLYSTACSSILLISSWLCSACFSLCSVINMYLPSHVLIQKLDKYLSFDTVSEDVSWSIYHVHPWRRNMPYSSFLRKNTQLFTSEGSRFGVAVLFRGASLAVCLPSDSESSS